MLTKFLKAKLHQASVTHVERDYDGSCAIDRALLDLSGIREYEQIDIYNITNGERLTTYAIAAPAGSGVVSLNGAAAHKAAPRDRVIICCYAALDEKEALGFQPTLLYLDSGNRVVRSNQPVQAA